MERGSVTRALDVRQLGVVPYSEALELQHALRAERMDGAGTDTVLLLEHPHVITQGRATRPGSLLVSEDELAVRGYALHRVARGGDVTYHGPGQVVGYPILALDGARRDVHDYLRRLESVLLDTVADFGISAMRRPGYTGVWIDPTHKLASIGVGVRRWVTTHGFALNVDVDPERFSVIVPCGLQGVRMVSMTDLCGRRIPLAAVRERLETHLRKELA